LLEKSKKGLIVAIGECGFDFSPAPLGEKTRSFKDQQVLFLGQIMLALEYNLPLMVHVRQANEQALEFIKNFAKENPPPVKNLKGVFHCYSGGKKRITQILDLPGEWFFGFDGNLTYDKGLQNTFVQIPKEKIVVETDAPFLAPEPYRGQINTPAYLPYIVKKASQLWQMPFEQTKAQLRKNTLTLFQALSLPKKSGGFSLAR
jgi:TatD DNase family protein